MRRLGDEIKKGLTLKPLGEISGGFTISYDGGKSHYDFTDKGIAEYLSACLNPELSAILNKAASGGKKYKKNN
jgi:vacuolar-type H+-ATPase subunit E/Vma4